MRHDRSRSPFSNGDFQTRVPHPQSPEERVQTRGPPDTFGSGAGRFHSPGSVRHKFFRENHENQRSSDDRYMAHGPSPLSPHNEFGARYESCDPQSPIADRSPDRFTRPARVFHSPDTRRERNQDHFDTFTPSATRGSGGTIDFDGLRDVPVGPRLSINKIEAKSFGPDAYSPYILIPPEHVPPLPHLTRHLQGMLKSQKPKKIVVNNQGWHLYFDDSSDGRLKLKRCYHEFHKKNFFDYKLNMQYFLDGIDTGNQHSHRARTSLEGNGSTCHPSSPRISANSSPKISHFAGREIAYPDPVRRSEATHSRELSRQEASEALKNTPSRVLQQDLSRHLPAGVFAQSASPVNANISMLSQRSERDDTASQASGITRSDSSRIKRDKCHVCSGESSHGLSILVQCSTCRRKYHRRCHQDPVIPDGLDEDHTWSCRSCIKKGRTHRGRQQGKSLKPVSSLGPVPSGSSPLPAPLDTDGEKHRGRSDGPAPPRVDAQELPNARVNAAQSDSTKAQIATRCHVTARIETEAVLAIGNGDLTLSDPDDLVERSFSAAANVSQAQPQCQKPGKFKMTRIKLQPSVQIPKAQQAQSEEPQSQVESPKSSEHVQVASDHNVTDSNTSVPAARNSVADLRALAHKAHETHRSAIKNVTGMVTEGHVENGERQSRDIHSASAPKSPSVEQPTGQSGARQVSEHARSDAVASVAPTRMSQIEIPESPDDVRLGSTNTAEAVQDTRLLAKHTRVSSGLPAEHISDTSPVQSGKHTASKKSKVPSFLRCNACQKKIPAGPSGMTRLCFGCKRKAVATEPSQVVSANSGTDTTRQATAAVVMPTDEQRVVPHKGQEHVNPIPNDISREQEQSAPASQLPDSVNQASPARPSTTEAQPTEVGAEDTALCNAVEDGDMSTNLAGPTNVTTCLEVELQAHLIDRPHALDSATGSPIDIISERQNSCTRDAVDDLDATTSPSRIEYIKSIVGDSYSRPEGSRTILIAMAMSTRPDRCMQAQDVLSWISANIPTCKAGEGNWHRRIVSQLTQGSRSTPGADYWLMKEWNEGDGGAPGKKWYELLPEKADEMWTWCPLRQQPVAPRRPNIAKTCNLKRQRASRSMDSATALRGTFSVGSASTPTTPLTTESRTSTNGLGSSKRDSMTASRIPDPDVKDVDESSNTNAARVEDEQSNEFVAARSNGPRVTTGTDPATSDDEPLLKKRRRDELAKPRPPRLEEMQQHTPANTEMEELPDAGSEAAHVEATEHRDGPDLERRTEASNSLNLGKKAKVVILNMRKGSLSEGISKLPSRDHLVTSFYNEWPEYCEDNMFDDQAKMAEIIKRPTRKQMFGKPALCSRLRVRGPSVAVPAIPVNVSPEKRARLLIDPDNPYPWEKDVGATLEDFASLDEFFDFPANMIPIISEGQLAYRDGTRTDDGRLPRAREVFKP